MKLAEKLRSFREQQGWSQRELATHSGLASGTISHLETGKFRGDLATHQKLVRGLGITLAELYRGVEDLDWDHGSTPLTPRSEAIETFRYNDKAKATLLARQIFQKPFLPQLLTLEPGGQTHLEQARTGWKFVFVLKGQVEVQVGEERCQLEPYGTIFFEASKPHQFSSVGEATAECLTVTSPVGV